MSNEEILIISSTFPPGSSSMAKRLGDLLTFFPKNKYVVLTNSKNTDLQNEFNPGNTFYFSEKDLLNNLHTNHKLINYFKKWFYINQISDIVSKSVYIIKHKQIKSILVIADTGPCMIATVYLLLLTRKPVDLYFFDIYARNYTISKQSRLVARLIEPLLMKRCRYILFVWDEMQTYYSKIYPQFASKMRTIPSAIILQKDSSNALYESRLTKIKERNIFIYAGTIGNAQFDPLYAFANVIKKHNDWALVLFTPHKVEEIRNLKERGLSGDNIYFDYILGAAITREYQKATGLLFPFSFNEQMRPVVSTMFGGKAIEYLTSGVPIIVLSPSYAAISRFVNQYNIGITINNLSRPTIERRINCLLQNKTFYIQTASRAQKITEKFFDARKNCETLYQLLFAQDNL